MDVNGSPATEAFLVRGVAIAYGRLGNNGGYITETIEGMRRKHPTRDSAERWLGGPIVETVSVEVGNTTEGDAGGDAGVGKKKSTKPK